MPVEVTSQQAEFPRTPWIANVRRDICYALRQLRRSPGFAVMTVLTLALGIGANTAMFSLVEGVLLRPLPYRNSDRLVVVWQTDALHHESGAYFNSYREFQVFQEPSRSFEKLAALTWARRPDTTLWQGKPIDMLTIPASVDFFSLLGENAAMGRTFTPNDLGNGCTVVLAHRFWEQKLGAPRDVIGQAITLGKSSCQIVGVMPSGFSFYPVATDAWTLITPASEFTQKPWHTMVGAFGLLKPGVTRAAAEAELTAIQAQVIPEAPADLNVMRTLTPDVLALQSNFIWLAGRNLRKGLWLLLSASTLILLLAAINVGSLVLSRALVRAREMAIRAAIGATRRRLVGQAFTESLLLGALGTSAGVAVAAGLLQWFRAATPIELPPGAVIVLDGRVLLFTALCGLAASILFGIFPAWRASHADANTALKSGNLTPTHATPQRAAQTMVVMQVALSMVLLAGAGLLSESLWKMATTDLGYRTAHLFTARINLPESYTDIGARSRLAQTLEANLRTLPGVSSVALGSDYVPGGLNSITIVGQGENSSSDVATHVVSPGAFHTLGIPLLRGRGFDAHDQKDTPPVAIINAALVKEYFRGDDPLGARIKLSRADDASAPWLTIVGVAGDVKTTTVFQEMGYIEPPVVYRPLAQSAAPPSLALMVAVNGSPLSMVSEIQQRLSAVDANLVLGDIDGLRARREAALSPPRFRSVLFGGFAVLALVLALIGIFGVLSQAVARRKHDIGIRMALGANRDRILRAVLGQACAMTLAGVAIGAACAAAAIRILHGMLYGIAAQGAGELMLVAMALLIGAVAAAWAPAWRAASIDPMRVLRQE